MFKIIKILNSFIILVCISLLLMSCSDDNNSIISPEEKLAPSTIRNNETIIQWMQLILDSVKDNSISPPVASRIFAYTGIAFYEGISASHLRMRSLEGQLNGLTRLPKIDRRKNYDDITIACTTEKVVVTNLFENSSTNTESQISALWQKQIDARRNFGIKDSVLKTSIDFGERLGSAILAWADADGYYLYKDCDYTPLSVSGFWEPTPPNYGKALLPCWGKLRPFIMKSADEFDPGPPPPYSEDPNSIMYKETFEVYYISKNLTSEQREIALYWADPAGTTYTPPGHSISILKQIIEDKNLALIPSARAFARLGIGLADAFISVWNTKYTYNVIRPVSYIQKLIDPNWQPLIATPPFPEYTSGHSVQSGAFDVIMTSMFGDIEFTDRTNQPPRSFKSFHDVAYETGISRLYGGIHYRTCVFIGLEQGKKIGMKVINNIKWFI